MKKVLSVLLMLGLIFSICVSAASCQSTETKNDSTGDFSDYIPGGESGVSQEVLEALSQSGTVTSYVFTDEDEAGRPLNLGGLNNKTFQKLFSEVYGGTLDLKRIEWEGMENTYIVDFAANEAPDLIYGCAKLWPKIANRGMVFSVPELKKKGVVGTDHPVLKDGHEAVEANFTFKDETFGLALHRAGCFWVIVNEDLYAQYNVKSPSKYYQEGLWDFSTLAKSSNELITAAGLNDSGTRDIFGYYCWDSTAFVRANGQQIIGYDPKTGVLRNDVQKTEVVEGMEFLRSAFQDGWATKNGDSAFPKGRVGIMAITDENVYSNCKGLTFKWSLIPFPKGPSNKNNQLPGSVSAWMVTSSSDNPQGVVNLVIAYLAAVKDGTIPLGEDCVESFFKNDPDTLNLINDNKINAVNDNMFGVGSLWSAQWDFWNAIRTGKSTVAETVNTYTSMFDAQVEQEMAHAE